MKDIKEILLNSSQTMERNLLQFVDKISEFIPNLCSEGEGWYEKFNAITEYIWSFLEKQGLLLYEDVSEMAEHMMDSASELNCLSKILEWIKEETNTVSQEQLSEKDYLKIDKTIQYFENELENLEQHLVADVERQFSKYFMYLKDSQDIKLNDKQIERLHDLVTLLVEKTECYSLFYRKVLLHISLRNTEQRNVVEEHN